MSKQYELFFATSDAYLANQTDENWQAYDAAWRALVELDSTEIVEKGTDS